MNRYTTLIALTICALASTATAAVPDPAPAQSRPIALTGATIHTMEGPAISNGTIVFDNGKITAVGTSVTIPPNAERIDVTGKHIYPSMIDASTTVGLTETESVRATNDMSETGDITPNVKAEVAVNPESEIIPVTRSNGVLLTVANPTGGVLSGTSALMQLDGWTWEDLTLKAPIAMHINWPNMKPVTAWWMQDSEEKQLEKRDEQLKNIRQAFADARSYMNAKKAGTLTPEHDSRWESMIPVLEGKVPVIADVDEIQQIQAVVAFAEAEKVKLILRGGYDAPHCAELLKRNNIPVIVDKTHRLPQRDDDPYDAPFTVPERLRQAGIKFCISNGGASNVRNLPYQAATAASYGLPKDDAIKSITLYAAQILGVDDRVGSLAAGKDATLFIADGDILEIPTQVEHAFIQGRDINMTDKQKVLWAKYKEKYRRLGIGDEDVLSKSNTSTGSSGSTATTENDTQQK